MSKARSSAAAQPAAAAAEGGLFESVNGFGSIRRPLSQLMGSHSLHSAATQCSGETSAGTDGRRSHLDPRRRPCQSQRRCTSAGRAAGIGPGRRSKVKTGAPPSLALQGEEDTKRVSLGEKDKPKLHLFKNNNVLDQR